MNKPSIRFDSFNKDYLSKDSGREWKGLFTIVIFVYHMAYSIGLDAIKPFVHGGTVVAFFFFFSGYGCAFSYFSKKDYTKNYIRRRIVPILAIYCMVNFLCFIAYLLMGKQMTPKTVFTNFFKFGEPLVRYSWYVVVILVFYFFTFVLMKLFTKVAGVVGGMVIVWLVFSAGVYKLNWSRHWYDTSILFIVGMLWAWKEERIIAFIKRYYCLSFAGLFVLYATSAFIMNNVFVAGRKNTVVFTVSEIVLVLVIFVASMKISVTIPQLRLFGDMSLEIYICQGLVFDILHCIGLNWPIFAKIIFCIAVTMIVAWPLWVVRRKLRVKTYRR